MKTYVTKITRESLSPIAVFRELPFTELKQIESALRPLKLPAKAPLLTQGDKGEWVYFVLSGTICVYRPQVNEERFILNLIGAGDMLGEICALDNLGHTASAITTEASGLLQMRRDDFRAFKKQFPLLARNTEYLLLSRLRFATAHNEALFPYDTQRRVARILLALSDRFRTSDETGPVTIPVRLTQDDLAELIGAARQNVCAKVNILRKANCIEINTTTHRITVTDRAALMYYGL